MRWTFILFFQILISFQASAIEVGKVLLAVGQPHLVRDNQTLAIKRGDVLHQSDLITTPAGAKILFQFLDNSRITLSENTQFDLTKYEFNAKKKSSNVELNMAKGVFRLVTGAIGQQKNPKLLIHTPVATIGIRGTTVLGDYQNGTLNVVMTKGKGAFVFNKKGRTELNRNNGGTTVNTNNNGDSNPPTQQTTWSKTKIEDVSGKVVIPGEEDLTSNDSIDQKEEELAEEEEEIAKDEEEEVVEEKEIEEEAVEEGEMAKDEESKDNDPELDDNQSQNLAQTQDEAEDYSNDPDTDASVAKIQSQLTDGSDLNELPATAAGNTTGNTQTNTVATLPNQPVGQFANNQGGGGDRNASPN